MPKETINLSTVQQLNLSHKIIAKINSERVKERGRKREREREKERDSARAEEKI